MSETIIYVPSCYKCRLNAVSAQRKPTQSSQTREAYGVRRQSAASTALSNRDTRASISRSSVQSQSGVAASPPHSKCFASLERPADSESIVERSNATTANV